MHLKKISLFNFKNFEEANFEFEHKINCFVGKNGIGKTNILDAIYHLAFGKSYFNTLAIQNIKHGSDFFVIDGEFIKQDRPESIICSLKKGQKKILKRNGKLYEKFSDHLGLIPMVIISPTDADLIREGSEVRRKFIDSVISQLDNLYLQQLIQYQKVLAQRNALLKYFALNRIFEQDTLDIYNEQLANLGTEIFKKREQFLSEFIPIFNHYYKLISNSAENVFLAYESQLKQTSLKQLLSENIHKDRTLQYTSIGIHKDDLAFLIEGYPIKKFGSQGQQKSYLIALKLAQFEFVKKQSGEKPILLFDDIFDKLDEDRVSQIVSMVNNEEFGQLFISDTHPDRTENIVKQTHQLYKIFNI
ncbi:DNA recombination protein RecF [Flavobacterium covae]|uniref:DNA replication and repair protein RecF n=1 Tax=Flavobacterium covae TaxID=2906076 RepID=A0ABW8PGK2_9FLAO|nr:MULTISPECIES: DNA replication and repair protein RecF [Flavobacterium]MCJ1806435.1 DNA replication and repair protein RecF [Flavobacterium covae]OWP80458.1 DNA recombination protein RecF [Flavobacterium covae]OXA78339.1 DNA recombination protein RecF [Flavobacterium columnare NBRC 100251 = ATCC 23463]POR23145.1 DNA recombination protein RecF [Flavobacterium columnare]